MSGDPDDLPLEDAPDEQADALGSTEDTATPSGARRRETRIQREEREADEFWRGVLSTEIGRREMWKLIADTDAGHAFETRFPSGPMGFPDPNAAWYERGQQDFCLRLYQAWLRRDPAAVHKMHEEHDPRFRKPGLRRLN